jgi:hypothetical protein
VGSGVEAEARTMKNQMWIVAFILLAIATTSASAMGECVRQRHRGA